MRNEIQRLKTILKKDVRGDAFSGSPKAEFRNAARLYFKKLLKELGADADIRFNAGGVAVSGEATLHGDNFYVQISKGCRCPEIMFRTCEGRKDYSGGPNRWLGIENLEKLEGAVRDLVEIPVLN